MKVLRRPILRTVFLLIFARVLSAGSYGRGADRALREIEYICRGGVYLSSFSRCVGQVAASPAVVEEARFAGNLMDHGRQSRTRWKRMRSRLNATCALRTGFNSQIATCLLQEPVESEKVQDELNLSQEVAWLSINVNMSSAGPGGKREGQA